MQFNLNNKAWRAHIEDEFKKAYMLQLLNFLDDAYTHKIILPAKNALFNAYNECPFDKVKVVILGQDPYPTPGHAHGLSFSVEKNVPSLPKSLRNIFQELHTDVGRKTNTDGNLTGWAKQGVFLLNSVLTVEAHKSDAHAGKGWEQLTDKTIEVISKYKKNVVFLLWGNKAQAKQKLIDANKHCILTAPHPSPLSAYKGFFGCKHFSKTNLFLEQTAQSPIKW
jgi:uracil-DNA glycosylase